MSAFIVDDVTINRVVAALAACPYKTRTIQTSDTPYMITGEEGKRELAQAMFMLNVAAVEARYGKGTASDFRALDFQYRPEAARPMQAFKSLQCWKYQCAEGNVPETKLFKLMERIAGQWAISLLSDTAEYDREDWE